jgi:siroheme synthase-like protein
MSFQFPVTLDVEGQRCLVIGTGAGVAERVRALAAAKARVTVLGGALAPGVAAGEVRWIARDYQPGDLAGYLVVIAATNDRALNARIWEEAEARGTLFNAVDDPEHCRFSFPAIHRQGDLLVAVSSNGRSPALAARIRDRIAGELGEEYGVLLDLLSRLRQDLADRYRDFESRRAASYRLVDSPALELIRRGEPDRAEQLLRTILEGTGAGA